MRTILVILSIWSVGCVTHYSGEPASELALLPRTPGTADSGSLFDYQPGAPELSNHDRLSLYDDRHTVHELVFPSAGDNGQPGALFRATLYLGRSAAPRPMVIVLPIWGTSTYPPDSLVRMLRRRAGGDLHIIQVHGPNYLFDWDDLAAAPDPDNFAIAVRRDIDKIRHTVIDLRRLMDWLESHPSVDPAAIGLVGFSMGAIVSSMLVSHDQRPAATILVLGAANPGRIFAVCDGRLGSLRSTIRKRFGWSTAEYEQLFRDAFAGGDPATHPGRVDPDTVLIVDSRRDPCMPRDTQDALWEAMGRPARISYRFGHKMAFMSMTPLGGQHMTRQIANFLERSLIPRQGPVRQVSPDASGGQGLRPDPRRKGWRARRPAGR